MVSNIILVKKKKKLYVINFIGYWCDGTNQMACGLGYSNVVHWFDQMMSGSSQCTPCQYGINIFLFQSYY